MTENAEAWADAAKDFMHPAESVQKTQSMMRALSAAMPSMFQPQPSVPWNGPLTATRNLAWVQFPFHEVRQIKSVLGGTVNDLALAILSGGLGRYLRSLGQSTESLELRAMCPVSMRRPDEQGQLGNLVSTMIAPLHVGILDPVERLSAEREAMEHLKQVDQAGGFYLMAELGNRVPPAWQSMAGLFSVTNTLFHTVSTNVPGPQIPLYLAGSELLHLYPLGPLAAGLGLFVAILSYNQVLTIGLTVEPNRIPDPWALADHLREAFEELRAAADIEAETRVEVHAGEPSRRKPRRGKKKRGTGKRKRSSAS